MKFIIDFINSIFNTKKQLDRRGLKDILPGEEVIIEWDRIKGKIGPLLCVNNDPINKKILLKVCWRNYLELNHPQYESIIFNYNDKVFENFYLLNNIIIKSNDNTDSNNLYELQTKMNKALEEENYELAEILQNKINKLSKK